MEDYKIVDGRIVSPGKFEGEPAWILTLWDMVLGGMADVSVHDGTMAIDGFELDERTAALVGMEARPGHYVCLWSDDQGFVSHIVMSEQELNNCEGFDVPDGDSDLFVDSDFDYGGESGYL